MKPKNSKRNRHTGKVNAFKRAILKKAARLVIGDRVYYQQASYGTRVRAFGEVV